MPEKREYIVRQQEVQFRTVEATSEEEAVEIAAREGEWEDYDSSYDKIWAEVADPTADCFEIILLAPDGATILKSIYHEDAHIADDLGEDLRDAVEQYKMKRVEEHEKENRT